MKWVTESIDWIAEAIEKLSGYKTTIRWDIKRFCYFVDSIALVNGKRYFYAELYTERMLLELPYLVIACYTQIIKREFKGINMKENKECTRLAFYHVITDTNLESFESKVGDMIHDGWILHGSMVVEKTITGNTEFYQVVVM